MRYLLVSAALIAAVGLAALRGGAVNVVMAPDFAGGGPWFNTGGETLTLAALRGKVVAVEIWTAGCFNCLNTLPYVKQWDAKYRGKGLVTIGVHSPEFGQEHAQQYVRERIAQLGITYPVVMDNDFKIWNAYRNAYWPTLYLIDKQGTIRYTHVGEGEYDQTERMIASLLAEAH